MSVNPIPEGHHTVTPYFLVKDADKFILFLEKAFNGELLSRHDGPNGRVMNAEVKVGSSIVMLGEPPAPHQPTRTMMYLYVPDVDAVHRQAVAAGGKQTAPVTDQFYGDRSGAVEDSEGNIWWIATRKESLTSEEIYRRSPGK